MSSRTRDGAEIRRTRMLMLFDLIENHPDLGLKKIRGTFMLKTGLRSSTINEMLEEAADSGLIEIDQANDKISMAK